MKPSKTFYSFVLASVFPMSLIAQEINEPSHFSDQYKTQPIIPLSCAMDKTEAFLAASENQNIQTGSVQTLNGETFYVATGKQDTLSDLSAKVMFDIQQPDPVDPYIKVNHLAVTFHRAGERIYMTGLFYSFEGMGISTYGYVDQADPPLHENHKATVLDQYLRECLPAITPTS